jgi:hypothetical protein
LHGRRHHVQVGGEAVDIEVVLCHACIVRELSRERRMSRFSWGIRYARRRGKVIFKLAETRLDAFLNFYDYPVALSATRPAT